MATQSLALGNLQSQKYQKHFKCKSGKSCYPSSGICCCCCSSESCCYSLGKTVPIFGISSAFTANSVRLFPQPFYCRISLVSSSVSFSQITRRFVVFVGNRNFDIFYLKIPYLSVAFKKLLGGKTVHTTSLPEAQYPDSKISSQYQYPTRSFQ